MSFYKSKLYKNSIKNLSRNLPKKKCSILITGACGLIGSCAVDVLTMAGYNVYALGRSRSKLQTRFGKEKQNLFFIEHDICKSLDTEYEFDYIIHTASFSDPRSYALYPVETALTNVLGAKTVLDYCKNHKKTRALLTSTFEVYGKLDHDFYSEEECGLINFNQIRSCYPESKRTTEILFKSYNEEYGVDEVIVRFSSIYGPTMLSSDSKAHAQFLFKAIKGENIVLKSNGEQKRTYCYVMDAVSAMLKVLFDGKRGQTYNIANSKSVATIAEVAKVIADIARVKVVFDLPDEIEKKGFSNPQNCVLDTRKLENLGWHGVYDLESGLKETFEILKEISN